MFSTTSFAGLKKTIHCGLIICDCVGGTLRWLKKVIEGDLSQGDWWNMPRIQFLFEFLSISKSHAYSIIWQISFDDFLSHLKVPPVLACETNFDIAKSSPYWFPKGLAIHMIWIFTAYEGSQTLHTTVTSFLKSLHIKRKKVTSHQ